MPTTESIKTAFDRTTKALQLKPSLGLGTGTSIARVQDGLTCQVIEGKWNMVTDMPESVGGSAAGPTPGVLGRAALGSCLAIGYKMRAAAMNIPVGTIEVEVQADYDDGALFGTSAVAPGYLEVRYNVTIETDAPDEVIQILLDEADHHSPYLDVFSRGQHCVRSYKIVSPQHQS